MTAERAKSLGEEELLKTPPDKGETKTRTPGESEASGTAATLDTARVRGRITHNSH